MKRQCNEIDPDTKHKCIKQSDHPDDHRDKTGLVWSTKRQGRPPSPPKYHCVCGMTFPHPVTEEHIATHNDPVNHPAHYTAHPSGVECIDIVEHMTFNKGNAIKYVWRAGEKGPPEEDLRKAIWYLEREIKRIKNG